MKYKFKYGYKKDGKLGDMLFIELKDGTQFVIIKGSLVVRYPKKKFKKIFSKQKGKYYSLEYQPYEINALLKGIKMAGKKLNAERKK